jgi:ribosome recycling factor
VPEDSIKAGEKDVQKITDDSIAKVDEVIKAKEKEIMTI